MNEQFGRKMNQDVSGNRNANAYDLVLCGESEED